jgi:hypothetical protein
VNAQINRPQTAWYRQFWPWLLIAIPLAGVVMSGIGAFCAYRFADIDVRAPQIVPLDKTNGASPR